MVNLVDTPSDGNGEGGEILDGNFFLGVNRI